MLSSMLASLDVLYKNHRHVAVKIESSWGTGQCDDRLHSYIVKNRDERIGFYPCVYKEILNLYILHSKKYGSKYSMLVATSNLNVFVQC